MTVLPSASASASSQPRASGPDPTLIPAAQNDSLLPSNDMAGSVVSGTVSNALLAKRSRRSNPKVKTGCSNCKQRRIKCDEKRPACSQCVRSSKDCTGYPAPSRNMRAVTDIRIAPKPLGSLQAAPVLAMAPLAATAIAPMASSVPPLSLLLKGHSVVLPPRRANRRRRQPNPQPVNAPTPTIYHPSGDLTLRHTEGLYFELFRVQTASEISGYFNSSFWTQQVLQECHREIAIRHAVVALGALYKTLEQSCEPDSVPFPGAMSRMEAVKCHWQVAVRQYSEACNAMLLLNGESVSSYRTRLMASVLLACFDSFIGDHKQAIIQIQTGLGLLERLQDDRIQSPSSEGYVEEDILIIFTRLAIQAKSYDMAFHFPQPYVIRLGPQGRRDPSSPPVSDRGSPPISSPEALPYHFQSLKEARFASDKLCEMLLRFIEHLQLAKADASYTLPPSWKQYGLTFKDKLAAWSAAFEPIFLSRLTPGVSLLEKSGIAALKMFQINTNVLFLMMFCDTEVQFDAFLPHFKAIVELGWEVVGDDERRAAAQRCPNPKLCNHQHGISKGAFKAGKYATHHVKPSFSAELGIVPPLFVVATKCRDPQTRRQAIQLLRSSARREGMWDSELAANIGHWVMQVEESDNPFPNMAAPLDEVLPTRAIPEEKRIMVQAVDFDLQSRFANLKVGSRNYRQGVQDMRHKETRITW